MSIKFSDSFFEELNQFQSPKFDSEEWDYQDADEELQGIAEFIKQHMPHNSEIEPERIKFIYSRKPKKDGGRYVLGSLLLRDPLEKMVNDEFDYIVMVFYPVWSQLNSKNKAIQLDKILCGIQTLAGKEEIVFKKKQTDSREHVDNLMCFGVDDVIKSSETVHLATTQFIEHEKEAKKSKKKQRADDEVMDILENE